MALRLAEEVADLEGRLKALDSAAAEATGVQRALEAKLAEAAAQATGVRELEDRLASLQDEATSAASGGGGTVSIRDLALEVARRHARSIFNRFSAHAGGRTADRIRRVAIGLGQTRYLGAFRIGAGS